MRQSIHTQQQWWSIWECEFSVYQFEYWPSDLGILGAEESETGERDIRGNGDGDFILSRGLRNLERFEDGVCADHGVEERGGVGFLGIESWGGGGEWTVFCVAKDEVLRCGEG